MLRFNKLDSNIKDVFSKGYYSVIVRVLGAVARLLISVFIGRTLGPTGLGDINLINQIVTILMVFSVLGLDQVLIKNVAIGLSEKNFIFIGNSVYSAVIISLFSSVFVVLITVLSSEYLSDLFFESKDVYLSLLIMFLAILPQTLGRIYTSCINGYHKIWQSILFKEVLTPLLVGVGLLIYWVFNIEKTLFTIVLLYVFSKTITFLSSTIYWHRLFRIRNIKKRMYDESILKNALPLLLVSSMAILSTSTDVIMLGWLEDSTEVGLYTVASRLALLVLFFLQVSNATLSPKIASFYKQNKKKELQLLVQRVTMFLIILGIMFLLFFVVFGKFILNLWGVQFEEAFNVLLILSIGQLINISTGCSGLLLIMCGYGKIHSYISIIFTILNIILNYFLIKMYGASGAAIATSLTIAFENISKVYLAKKHTGILSIPI